MYAREVDGKDLSFGVSGKLWRDSLVLYDRKTGSLWSQGDGKAFYGELKGTKLEPLPSTMTTWKEWKAAHPETLVLEKPRGERSAGSPYVRYFADPDRLGVLGRENPDPRLPGKDLVFGLEIDGDTVAYPASVLARQPVIDDTVGGEPVVVYFDRGAGSAYAYSQRLDGRVLDLGSPEKNVLEESGTGFRFRAETGVCLSGGCTGRALTPLVLRPAYWFAWSLFRPGSRIGAARSERSRPQTRPSVDKPRNDGQN